MKASILKQMMKIVDANGRNMKDFYTYNLRELAKADDNTPFVWCVSFDDIKLLQINKQNMLNKLQDESYRYHFMHNPDLQWVNFLTACSGYKAEIYYYDGEQLRQIDLEDAENIVIKMWTPYIQELKDIVFNAYPNEYYGEIADIEMDSSTNEEIWDIVECGLEDILNQSMKKYFRRPKRATKHSIVLFGDENKNFVFTEFLDDKPINGGKFVFIGNEWKIEPFVD